MNGFDLLEAVGGIDDSFVTDASEERAGSLRAAKRRRWAALAAAVAVAVAVAVFVRINGMKPTLPAGPDEEGSVAFATDGTGGGVTDRPVPGTEGGTEPGTVAGTVPDSTAPGIPPENASGIPPVASTKPEPSSRSLPENTGEAVPPATVVPTPDPRPENASEVEGGSSGESFGGPTLPSEWSSAAPTVRGTGYTREEIDALLAREGWAIAQMAASETGCAPADVIICREGFCHTTLGAENVADRDYLTLPVCVGGSVVASVDLFRYEGELHYTVSAGGPRWDNLNRALRYGRVAFCYAGFNELAVAPDGTVFEITVDAAKAVAGQTDLYARAACNETVFSQAMLESALRTAEAAP